MCVFVLLLQMTGTVRASMVCVRNGNLALFETKHLQKMHKSSNRFAEQMCTILVPWAIIKN